MNLPDTAGLAVRLAGASAALLLAPGIVFAALLGVRARWDERIVLGFALSYSWIFVLSVAVPLFGWNVHHASGLTVTLGVALLIAWIRGRLQQRAVPALPTEPMDMLLVAVAAVAAGLAGWVIEPPFTGEEALDFTAISRFADGGAITLRNASLLPDAVPVYLFQPYQLAIAIISGWSGVDPLVAYIKLRSFLAPLTLVFVYSLIRHLSPSRIEARAAFIVVLMFVVLDVDTWQSNSLFPLVRRGGVGAGICMPVLMTLCLMATRHSDDEPAQRVHMAALAVAPVMLVASLSTHPLEMFPVLWFVAALAVAVVCGLDPLRTRQQTVALALLLAATTAVYVDVHSRLVPYVAEYERADKAAVRDRFVQILRTPGDAIAGEPTEARDVLTRTIPATTAVFVGVPAMALAALRAPAAASVLALAVVPLVLVYSSPAGYMALSLLTSVETVRDVNAYFSLMGIIALAMGLSALAQVALRAAAWRQNGLSRVIATSAAGSFVIWAASTWGSRIVESFAVRAMMQPEFLLLIGVVTLVAVVGAALRSRPIVAAAPVPVAVVLATICLALPFAVPEHAFGGVFAKRTPVTLLDRFARAYELPSVVDWPAYYETLKGSIAPRLPVPRSVVDELRRRIPPRQVVLADPRYSCAVVVLIDAYCINPEHIYGHYFQPAARYHADYVMPQGNGDGAHPFFNFSGSLTEGERRLLKEYGVSYVLTDPVYTEQIAAKLRDLPTATLEMDLSGYRLYRIGAT